MKKAILPILTSGVTVLLVSMMMIYAMIYLMPSVMDAYYDSIFRTSSIKTDWLFYSHPFILSASLFWFWHRFKPHFLGTVLGRALQLSLVYGIIAMLPIFWLTFSSINISALMVCTWFAYGTLQAFIAGLVFAKMSP
jgi:hypothetical protein